MFTIEQVRSLVFELKESEKCANSFLKGCMSYEEKAEIMAEISATGAAINAIYKHLGITEEDLK